MPTELATWYSTKAKLAYREAMRFLDTFRFAESIAAAQDAIEFGIKAVLEFCGVSYPTTGPAGHDPSHALGQLRSRLPKLAIRLARVSVVSKKWVATRSPSRYGEQAFGLKPQFRPKEANEALRDSKEVVEVLHTVENRLKFTKPVRVGILDGYVYGRKRGERAVGVHYATDFGMNDWVSVLRRSPSSGNFDVHTTPASCITNDFAVVLNPYGEIFPETDLLKRPVFQAVKDYVWSGGIFVNAGGFAFFYAWDVNTASAHPIAAERILIPRQINLALKTISYQELLRFEGSLLWSELGAVTTADTAAIQGPFMGTPFQSKSDKVRCGTLLTGKTQPIAEFRALTKAARGVVPLLRLTRKDRFGEVFPVAALRHGWGYFILAGMQFHSVIDMELLCSAIAGFCGYLQSK